MNNQEPKTTLKIFDFDGTTYNSPIPNDWLWDTHTLKKLMDAPNLGGYGWWQNTITLSDEITPESLFIDSTVEDIKEAMNEPFTVTMLLTGRTVDFMNDVKRILSMKGLVFDYYGLKPVGNHRTFEFKEQYITDILKNNQTINKIEVWEDRMQHVKKFVKLFNKLNIESEVHYVNVPRYHVHSYTEQKIVDYLIANAGKEHLDKVPEYYGVLIHFNEKYEINREI
jgi:hypothetical protein